VYSPSQFQETRPEVLHEHMRQHPLAAIIAATAGGLQANHVPLILEPDRGELGTLQGHIARANSIWRDLAAGAEVLVIFQGASHYISPNWYPSKARDGKVVPTWNYVVVHARGRISWIHEAAWLREFVTRLTVRHEPSDGSAWQVSDAPSDYIDQMLSAIVGLEIAITEITGKWKLSQNRNAVDRAGVVSALSASPAAASQQMASLVDAAGRPR
jgi:transcriptional regulator